MLATLALQQAKVSSFLKTSTGRLTATATDAPVVDYSDLVDTKLWPDDAEIIEIADYSEGVDTEEDPSTAPVTIIEETIIVVINQEPEAEGDYSAEEAQPYPDANEWKNDYDD